MLRTRDLDWDGGYYDPAPPGRYRGRRSFNRGYYDDGWGGPRWLWGLWLLAVGIGFVVLVAAVVGHDDPRPGLSDRSWLTLGLAAALVGLLGVHRLAGVVPLLRALAEYGVVALLVVLLATGPGPFAPAATNPPGRPGGHATARATQRAATAGKQAAHDCPPVRQLPAWVACLWRQAQQAHQPKPKPGPKALSPTPPARRTP
jgi:hypothetical protein